MIGKDSSVAEMRPARPSSVPPVEPRRRRRRWPSVVAGLTVVLIALHVAVLHEADMTLTMALYRGDEATGRTLRERLREHRARLAAGPGADDGFAPLPSPCPFQQVPAFGEDAQAWGRELGAGLLVFDANQDGRLDVFVPQTSSLPFRKTDGQGRFLNDLMPSSSTLYLNQGTEHGMPILKSVAELARANESYIREELLVENFFFPRSSARESRRRLSRGAVVAAAADLDADGRPDLILGNGLPGLPLSHERTSRIILHHYTPTAASDVLVSHFPGAVFGHLGPYSPRNNQDDIVPTARGMEPMGANTVLLNRGDQDGDGIPEWLDVTLQTRLGGRRNTNGLVVADLDRDGDLDVFEVNSPDLDLWPGGATATAGARNQLYLNQLAESGRLEFVEASRRMRVDGSAGSSRTPPSFPRLSSLPFLSPAHSLVFGLWEESVPPLLALAGPPAEAAGCSWSALAQDIDDDGDEDLWVAGSFVPLEGYRNTSPGAPFAPLRAGEVTSATGQWKGIVAADLDGDLHEDLFVTNQGGGTFNASYLSVSLDDLVRPSLALAGVIAHRRTGSHRVTHGLFDGSEPGRPLPHRVWHSPVLPPDASLPGNTRRFPRRLLPDARYDPDSLDPYEGAWGACALDVQNDGRTDLYLLGGTFARGGLFLPMTGSSPGRLLINATERPGSVRLIDRTAEYHAFNIHEVRYDRLSSDGFLYRPAPALNWHRPGGEVTSEDTVVWGVRGPRILDLIITQDFIQLAENGRTALAADIDGDGYEDLLTRSLGGYDSRRSTAPAVVFEGEENQAGPPREQTGSGLVFTGFEPGETRLLRNTHGDGDGPKNHWLKVLPVDDTPEALNRDAIGARIVLDDRWVRTRRIGGPYGAHYLGPMHFGLGRATANRATVHWPDRERTVTHYDLGGLQGRTVLLYRSGKHRILD